MVGPETALKVSPHTIPIRFCSRWGLPCRFCCQSRGGLLPHPFTLAAPKPEGPAGGLLSVALSLGSPPPAINRHRVSMEPGLSSPAAFRLLLVRPPGQLTRRIKVLSPENANEKAHHSAARPLGRAKDAVTLLIDAWSIPKNGFRFSGSCVRLTGFPGCACKWLRRPRGAASPSSSNAPKPGSSAWRHGRHCT